MALVNWLVFGIAVVLRIVVYTYNFAEMVACIFAGMVVLKTFAADLPDYSTDTVFLSFFGPLGLLCLFLISWLAKCNLGVWSDFHKL